jgi:hypothetical protein
MPMSSDLQAPRAASSCWQFAFLNRAVLQKSVTHTLGFGRAPGILPVSGRTFHRMEELGKIATMSFCGADDLA